MIASDGTCAASRSAILASKRWSNHWSSSAGSRCSASSLSVAPMVVSLILANEEFEFALVIARGDEFVAGLTGGRARAVRCKAHGQVPSVYAQGRLRQALAAS